MRAATRFMLGIALAVPGLVASSTAAIAQAAAPANMAHTHLGHVADRFGDTPGNTGLIAAASAEAAIAAQHAGLANQRPDDLANMQLHAGHVMHAIDPALVGDATGMPGTGYGLKKAATAAATHIRMAAEAAGASAAVKLLAGNIAVAATNSVTWSDQIVALAERIRTSTDAGEANELVVEMQALAAKLRDGADANSNGEIDAVEGEAGLTHAGRYASLIKRAEGLGNDDN